MLEGEGCFTINKMKKSGKVYLKPRVQMNSTDHDVILRIQAVTGVGTIMGPTPYATHPNWKPRSTWVVQKQADAIALMEAVLPLMCERRSEQIQRSLDMFMP